MRKNSFSVDQLIAWCSYVVNTRAQTRTNTRGSRFSHSGSPTPLWTERTPTTCLCISETTASTVEQQEAPGEGRGRSNKRKCVLLCVCGRAAWRRQVCQTDTNTLISFQAPQINLSLLATSPKDCWKLDFMRRSSIFINLTNFRPKEPKVRTFPSRRSKKHPQTEAWERTKRLDMKWSRHYPASLFASSLWM